MADTVVESLLVEIRTRTEALERGLSAAQAQVDDFYNRSQRGARETAAATESSSQQQAAAFAATAAAAAAAFAAIVSAIKTGISAANEYTSAMVGLQSIAEGTGQDFGALKQRMQELTEDGLIPMSNAATAFKNLLARGFDGQEAVDIITRLKDSAAFGRQANLQLGEAVQSATEGLKNENSVLVDNAGVTKNVAKMWEDYAKQLGKATTQLTASEKRQAEYNGIMEETRYQVGDAAKYAETFAGAQAEQEAATLRVEQALGAAIQNGYRPFLEMLTPIINGLADLIEEYPALAAAITTGVAAFAAIIIVINTYKGVMALAHAANVSFATSLGWVGLIAGAIAGIVALTASYESNADAAARQMGESQKAVASLKQEQNALKEYQSLAANSGTKNEELAAARDRLIAQFPHLVQGYDAEGNAIIGGNEKVQERIDLLNEEIAKEKERLALNGDLLLADAHERRAKAKEKLLKINEEIAAANEKLDAQEKARAELAESEYADLAEYLEKHSLKKSLTEEATDAINRQKEAAEELAAAEADITNVLIAQYESVLDSYGELNAGQQLLAESAMEQALQEEMTQQQFATLLQQRLTDVLAYHAAWKQLEMEKRAEEQATRDANNAALVADELKAAQEAKAQYQTVKALNEKSKAVKSLVKEYGSAQKGSDAYKKSSTALEKAVGMTREQIETAYGSVEAFATAMEADAANASASLADALRAAIAEIIQTGVVSAETKAEIAELTAMLKDLGLFSGSGGGGGGGGGGSPRKAAWEEELEMIERVRSADEEYAQAYLDHINALLTQDNLSKSERARLEKERTYAQMQVNGELEQAHIEYLQGVLRREKLNAEERLAIEQQLFDAKKAAMQKYYDLAGAIQEAYTAKLQAERDAQLAALQEEADAESAWSSNRIAAVRAASNARIEAIQAEIRAIDDLIKAQQRADQDESDEDRLKRLRAQRDYEKDEYNQVKLDEQIAALEESIRKRKDKEALEDQKQALNDQIAELRSSTEQQIAAMQQAAETERKIYDDRMKAAEAYWDNRLKKENIQQEALTYMISATEEEIVQLLRDYAPDYFDASEKLGQAAYDAIKPKMDAIIAQAKGMADAVVSQAKQAAAALASISGASASSKAGVHTSSIASSISAFAAAPEESVSRALQSFQARVDNFVGANITPVAQISQKASTTDKIQQSKTTKVEQTVVIQAPVPSTYQTARALRRESERLAEML